jgi:hypothetical protein
MERLEETKASEKNDQMRPLHNLPRIVLAMVSNENMLDYYVSML